MTAKFIRSARADVFAPANWRLYHDSMLIQQQRMKAPTAFPSAAR